MARLRDAPPRENVRQRLRSELLTDEDFDAFCIDYFPVVAQRLSGGLNRVQKENLLLQLISPAQINQRLRKLNVDEQNTWGLKPFIAAGLIVVIGAGAVYYRYIYSRNDQPNIPQQRVSNGAQLEIADPSAVVKAGPLAAKPALPAADALPPEAGAQPLAPSRSMAPVAAKPSRAVNSKPALPARRPGPVQVNRIHGNRGNVTIIQNNN